MSRTVIVIPCYNEAKRLEAGKFARFRDPSVRFLFVDDGSTDATVEALEALRLSNPDAFEVCRLSRNAGKAEAVRSGFLRAFELRPDYVGFWDADLATPLDAILPFRDLLDARPEIEMVFGSRVRLLGRAIERNEFRHYLGRAFATAVSLALNIKVYDTQCGAKMFRRTPQLVALFGTPFLTRWIFDVEIIARLIQARRGTDLPPAEKVIWEFPLSEWRDVKGSKIRGRDFIEAAFELYRIHHRYLWDRFGG